MKKRPKSLLVTHLCLVLALIIFCCGLLVFKKQHELLNQAKISTVYLGEHTRANIFKQKQSPGMNFMVMAIPQEDGSYEYFYMGAENKYVDFLPKDPSFLTSKDQGNIIATSNSKIKYSHLNSLNIKQLAEGAVLPIGSKCFFGMNVERSSSSSDSDSSMLHSLQELLELSLDNMQVLLVSISLIVAFLSSYFQAFIFFRKKESYWAHWICIGSVSILIFSFLRLFGSSFVECIRLYGIPW